MPIKIKEWVGPDVLDRGLDYSFREYMKYFFLFERKEHLGILVNYLFNFDPMES